MHGTCARTYYSKWITIQTTVRYIDHCGQFQYSTVYMEVHCYEISYRLKIDSQMHYCILRAVLHHSTAL